MNCVPEHIYEDLGISEDAISRGSVTRSEYDPDAPEEPIQGELFDTVGDRNLDDVLSQRQFLEEGLQSLGRLKEMFSTAEAQSSMERAREQISHLTEGARDTLFSEELNGKMTAFKEKLQEMGVHAQKSPLRRGAGGVGTPNAGFAAGVPSYSPTNAAQRAKLAQQRSAAKAARAARKKNRRK